MAQTHAPKNIKTNFFWRKNQPEHLLNAMLEVRGEERGLFLFETPFSLNKFNLTVNWHWNNNSSSLTWHVETNQSWHRRKQQQPQPQHQPGHRHKSVWKALPQQRHHDKTTEIIVKFYDIPFCFCFFWWVSFLASQPTKDMKPAQKTKKLFLFTTFRHVLVVSVSA